MVMILNLFPVLVLVLALVIFLPAGVAVGTIADGSSGGGGGGGCVFFVGVPIVVLAVDGDIADVDICYAFTILLVLRCG